MLSFEVPGIPLTFNATSKSSHWQASKELAQWRTDFGWSGKAQRKKVTEFPVVIHVKQLCAKGNEKDAGCNYLAAKGAVDGLVDAKVLPGDGPAYVAAIVLHAPEVGSYSCLKLELEPCPR